MNDSASITTRPSWLSGVDYVKFIRTFGGLIFHAHMKDIWWDHGDDTVGVFGGDTELSEHLLADQIFLKIRSHHNRHF